MESKKIAIEERDKFFSIIKEKIEVKTTVEEKFEFMSVEGFGLIVQDKYIVMPDNFKYGIKIIYPMNAKQNLAQIVTYLSIDQGFAEVGSMIELEHLILRNAGVVKEDLELGN